MVLTFSIVFVVLQFCIGFVVFQFLKSKKSLTEKYGKVSVVLYRFCISFAVGFCGFAVQKKDTDRNILKPDKFQDFVRFCIGLAVGVLWFCSFAVKKIYIQTAILVLDVEKMR